MLGLRPLVVRGKGMWSISVTSKDISDVGGRVCGVSLLRLRPLVVRGKGMWSIYVRS